MAIAIEGAVILREYRGGYYNQLLYRRQCDKCGHVARGSPIPVSCEPHGTRMHGCYHRESFVCRVCGNQQAVKIEGGG